MQVVALHDVDYDMVKRLAGEEFTMEDQYVYPYELCGHIKRVVDEATDVKSQARVKRAKE